MKQIVHTAAHCVDTLLEVAESNSKAALEAQREIVQGTEVTVIDGPVTIIDSGGGMTEIVKVRYESAAGGSHDGWILYSSIK